MHYLPRTRAEGPDLVRALLTFGLLLVLVLTGGQAAASSHPVTLDAAELDEQLRSQSRLSRLPGVAVTVTSGGESLYQAALGETHGRPISPRSPFVIGSISKSFTALAVMMLVEEGRVDLDAPVTDYLPRIALRQEEGWGAVTVRHLLNQTSGIPTEAGFLRLGDQVTPDQVTIAEVRAVSDVGRSHLYSSLNYSLLGLLVEAAAGEPYEQFIQARIFDPLGMTDSYLDRRSAEAGGLVTGHQFWFGIALPKAEPAYERRAIPSGFIVSSAEDMGRYLGMLLTEGRTGDRTLLSPESVERLHAAWDGGAVGYGMGWKRGIVDGRPVLSHGGLTGSYSSQMVLLPEQDVAFAVLTNVNSSLAGSGVDALTDILLRHLTGAPPTRHLPIEIAIRLGFGLLLLFSLYGLIRDLGRWRRRGFPTDLVRSLPVIGRLVAEVAFGIALLILVPRLFDIPLRSMFAFQPDLALTLIVGALVAVANAPVSAFLRADPSP